MNVGKLLFSSKTAIISSKKPTRQRCLALLNVFNKLIHKFYRKYDKNCIKLLKIKDFRLFVIFEVISLKNRIYLLHIRPFVIKTFFIVSWFFETNFDKHLQLYFPKRLLDTGISTCRVFRQ